MKFAIRYKSLTTAADPPIPMLRFQISPPGILRQFSVKTDRKLPIRDSFRPSVTL